MIPLITTLHCITKVDNTLIIDVLSDYLQTSEKIFVSHNHVVFILDSKINLEDSIETFDLFQDDLGIRLFLYSGFVYDSKDSIKKEIDLLLNLEHTELYSTLYEVYIENNLVNYGLDSSIFECTKKIIAQDHETKNLIIKLWQTQGNITQSASELYIHRNTLIYRIDKFRETSLIDLKDPSELLIAYLVALSI